MSLPSQPWPLQEGAPRSRKNNIRPESRRLSLSPGPDSQSFSASMEDWSVQMQWSDCG